jgi:peptidylprolyl isomerase
MSEEEKEVPGEKDVEEEGEPEEQPEESPEVTAEEEAAEATEEAEEEAAETEEEAAEEAEEEEAEEIDEDAVREGDFILVEMTGKAVETGEVFDTTDEETAKSEDIYSDERTYGPKLVVVGEGWVLKGLDDRLTGIKLEEVAEVEIPPEEAFGERSPENVRIVPFRVLRSKGVNPIVGQQVELDGRTAMVRSVGAGRVQLDYNHPLSGRKIVYEVRATERYEGDVEKIRSLIGRRFLGIDVSLFKLKMLKKKVRIQIPDEIFFGENIQIAKRGVALDIQRYFPDLDEVEYTEVIKRAA